SGQASIPSGTPSPSESMGHPFGSTLAPEGVFGHLSFLSVTPSPSASGGGPAASPPNDQSTPSVSSRLFWEEKLSESYWMRSRRPCSRIPKYLPRYQRTPPPTLIPRSFPVAGESPPVISRPRPPVTKGRNDLLGRKLYKTLSRKDRMSKSSLSSSGS